MEVAIMERPALLRNSIAVLLVCLLVLGCSKDTPKDNVTQSRVLLNKLEQQIKFENGLLIINKKAFNGTLFTLHPTSTDTADLMSYQNGKEHDEWIKYHSSGRIKEKRFFDQGQKVGEYLAWWNNGNKQLHYFFVADEYEGTCKEWNLEGKLVKVMNYKKGHEEGHQQWWYDNGKVKANYIIKDARRYGLLGTKNCINVSDSIFSK